MTLEERNAAGFANAIVLDEDEDEDEDGGEGEGGGGGGGGIPRAPSIASSLASLTSLAVPHGRDTRTR